MHSPQSLLIKYNPGNTLVFSPVKSSSDFWPPQLSGNKYVLFKARNYGNWLHSGHRKPIQSLSTLLIISLCSALLTVPFPTSFPGKPTHILQDGYCEADLTAFQGDQSHRENWLIDTTYHSLALLRQRKDFSQTVGPLTCLYTRQ